MLVVEDNPKKVADEEEDEEEKEKRQRMKRHVRRRVRPNTAGGQFLFQARPPTLSSEPETGHQERFAFRVELERETDFQQCLP